VTYEPMRHLKTWHSPLLLHPFHPPTPPRMTTLICDCNQTQPLDPKALGQSLHEELKLHTALCRREAGAFLHAVQSTTDTVVVACTQEQRLFGDLAAQAQAKTSVIKFVNIRETGGWSRDAKQASPKIAALLAAAHLPEPEPVPTVTFKSAGRLLIMGALDAAEQAAALLSDVLNVTLFTQGPGAAWRAGWVRSNSPGPATTRLTWTCAPAAMPVWWPVLSKPLAWITKLT
jgi:hypothetical protein